MQMDCRGCSVVVRLDCYFFFFIICQGLTKYNNGSAVISDSVFHPKQLTENRMLYFWLSGQSFLNCGHLLYYYYFGLHVIFVASAC